MAKNRSSVLNAREELFCQEYLIDGIAAHAYLRAGYSSNANTARNEGYQLLRKPHVAKRILQLQAARSREMGLTQHYVIQELLKIAQTKILDVVLVHNNRVLFHDEISSDAAGAIAEISESKNGGLQVKMYDRVDALWKLAKLTGQLSDLNSAIATFRKYGYLVEIEDGNIRINDTFAQTDHSQLQGAKSDEEGV